jgi:hypothetical protein
MKQLIYAFWLVTLIAVAAICIGKAIHETEHGPVLTSDMPVYRSVPPLAPATEKTRVRTNYNMSIIPFGVTSVEEFKDARVVYVTGCYFTSYRRGDSIFWTQRCKNFKGELAITDGRQTVLMRCGNLVTYTPQEPSEDLIDGTLDVPEPPPPAPPDLIFADLLPPDVPGVRPPGGTEVYDSCCFWGFGGGGGIIVPKTNTPEPDDTLLICVVILLLVMIISRRDDE